MTDLSAAPRTSEPSQADLHALVELAPDGIFIADSEGRYTYVNQAGCRLLGWRREEIVGKTILDLIRPEDAPRLWESREQMCRGASHVAQWELRRKDGTWVTAEVHANILPSGQWQAVVRDLSERNAFLAKIETDRERLQGVLDTLPLGVLVFQPDGKLFYNRRTEELLGMNLCAEGGNAQYASRILRLDGSAIPPEKLCSTRALKHGETITGAEFLVERSDATRIPVLVSATPLRGTGDRVVGATVVFQDMSERMRMEQAIRDSEQLLRATFDILPVGVWVAQANGHTVRGNPASERIWKSPREVPLEQFWARKGWWVDSGKPIAADEWPMARALKKGDTSIGQLLRIQCHDGTFKTVINSALPLRDAAGTITGAIAVNEDITALHEAQEKQRASEQLLRTVIDLLPVGLWVADREGRITLANPASRAIWHDTRYVGPDQYGENKGWWVDSGEPIKPEDWNLWRAIRRGETSRGELIRIQCFDGSFKTVIAWAAPIRCDAGEIVGAVALNEDVTSLQHTQEQLRAAVRDREEILALVAHDLRNPLAGVIIGASMAERTARELPDGEPVRQLAEKLVQSAQHISGMVEDLFAVSVAGNGGPSMLRLQRTAVSALIASAAQAARPLLARALLTLEVKAAGDLPPVHADTARILRVLGNLLDNALKYTAAPGTITLSAERAVGGVRFAVSNSGPALRPEQLAAMFQPFWQAVRDRRGAGLGLSICRSIVEAHGGTIWAEPAEGQRVRVCFVLPRQPASA